MSDFQPQTITLRRLEKGDTKTLGDYYAKKRNEEEYHDYREVSPIPEGYEPCDLVDATKVLIGETWCLRVGHYIMLDACHVHYTHFADLGVIAIRPIPKPAPMKGETKVGACTMALGAGCACFPAKLIGETIQWEVKRKN